MLLGNPNYLQANTFFIKAEVLHKDYTDFEIKERKLTAKMFPFLSIQGQSLGAIQVFSSLNTCPPGHILTSCPHVKQHVPSFP